ncbi:hypothetical protein [Acinetobacter junii]|uniref:hypothetical protein n=1 Tax=Acinetobacter junii TaxID=40215 RepID=UPI0018FFBCE2|nr:hypothetical protein [Acinetobacter junii]MBJ8440067.1 hypothetical protein [Acinetobacter junii]
MTKDIEKPTLAEKQSFWAEQMPIFKEHYIMQTQLDVLYFDNESGNFEIKDESAIEFEKEDFLEAYHSVNTGWSMWLRAKAHEAEKFEGCVVVPVELSESIAEKLAFEKVEKPRQENDVVWQEIADRSYRDHLIQKKWEIIRNYKELVDAARGGNE